MVFASGGFLHADRVVIEGDKFLLFQAQEATDGLANPAVAANHHMALYLGRGLADGVQLQLAVGRPLQACGQGRGGAQQ